MATGRTRGSLSIFEGGEGIGIPVSACRTGRFGKGDREQVLGNTAKEGGLIAFCAAGISVVFLSRLVERALVGFRENCSVGGGSKQPLITSC